MTAYPQGTLRTFAHTPGYNFLEPRTPNIIIWIPLCYNLYIPELFAIPGNFDIPLGLMYTRLRNPEIGFKTRFNPELNLRHLRLVENTLNLSFFNTVLMQNLLSFTLQTFSHPPGYKFLERRTPNISKWRQCQSKRFHWRMKVAFGRDYNFTVTLSADREPFFNWTFILMCTKRTQNNCRISQWRLLNFLSFIK